jgi:hypothetical protein
MGLWEIAAPGGTPAPSLCLVGVSEGGQPHNSFVDQLEALAMAQADNG